ncbi:hypothetical protein, partial [Pseudomonas syringae group genomosp. 7]|uniref:hypothetical protein n=1 Tax=Pseudomonas syringae group genomosp. 7 TaxID=251699 RepID=UPI00376FAB4A
MCGGVVCGVCLFGWCGGVYGPVVVVLVVDCGVFFVGLVCWGRWGGCVLWGGFCVVGGGGVLGGWVVFVGVGGGGVGGGVVVVLFGWVWLFVLCVGVFGVGFVVVLVWVGVGVLVVGWCDGGGIVDLFGGEFGDWEVGLM